MERYLHVDSSVIRKDKEHNTHNQACMYRDSFDGPPKYVNGMHLLDKNGEVLGEFIYDPEAPLPCGACAYIVWRGEIAEW